MSVIKAPNTKMPDVIDIAGIHRSITSETAIPVLFKKILEAAFEITGSQCGTLLLCDLDKFICCVQGKMQKSASIIQTYELGFSSESFPLSILNHVFSTKETLYITKPYINCDFAEDPYIKLHMPETVICLPLIAHDKVVSVIYLEDMLSAIHLSQQRFGLLTMMLGTAALAIDNISLRNTQIRLLLENTFIENVSEGLCVFHSMENPPYLLFTLWNHCMEEITGFTLDDMNTDGWKIIKDALPSLQSIDKIFQHEDIHNMEHEIMRKDGTKRIIVINTYKKYDTTGTLNIFVTVTDITVQKQVQIELQESAERYKILFDLSPEAICVHDNGTIVLTNPSAARILGLKDSSSLSGRPILDLVHEDYKRFVLERISSVRAGSSFLSPVEEKFIKDDGSVIDVEVAVAPFPYRGKNYAQVTVRDITDQKKMQTALKVSEERYRLLVNMLPDAVYIIKDNKICFSNKTGAAFLGVNSPEELIGKGRTDFAIPMQNTPLLKRELNEQLIKKGRIAPVEEKYLRKTDNLIMDIETIAKEFNYYDDNAILVVCRDISERKQAKLLQRQMEETAHVLAQTVEYDKLRTEFFANISHELRTPINVVMSSLQLFELILKNNDMELGKIFTYIKIMKQNCYRLIRLVNNLIDVTKIDAGYFNINLINCNIVSIVEDITLSVVPYIENKDISLTFDTNTEEKFMACDPDKIERIMLNLISNAFKFTDPNGSIWVTLKDLDDHIEISVKDTGIGIPKDKQKLIFQRFIQVDKSLSREHQGSGIGLAIVKSLVELQSGSISINSEYEKGCEFIITLPVKLVDTQDKNCSKDTHEIQGNIEKINIEFSDIYI